MSTNPLSRESNSDRNVLDALSKSVPLDELGHSVIRGRNYISEHNIDEIAIEKYRSTRKGTTFNDVRQRFQVKKSQAQRSLKHFHAKSVLFTAEDLVKEGIFLLQNTSPQQYFPVCIKADIIQDLKKRKSVLVEPTGVNLSNISLISNNKNLEYQKAQSFLDVLIRLPFAPLYIHKLQLRLSIDKQYYKELTHKEGRINRAKTHEEIIGRRHVTYTFSPNGTVEIAVKSSDTPFRLETDEDESTLFSFLGQVKDRLLYRIGDIKERSVPAVTEWVLKACDLNKDITIDDKAQLTLPDIQLKYADRVFRQYVKCLNDKAVYRSEESLTLSHRVLLKEALDNIRYPHKSIIEESKDSRSSDRRAEQEMTTSPTKYTSPIDKEIPKIFDGVFAAMNKTCEKNENNDTDAAINGQGELIHVLTYALEFATRRATVVKQQFEFDDDTINKIIRAAKYGVALEFVRAERIADDFLNGFLAELHRKNKEKEKNEK